MNQLSKLHDWAGVTWRLNLKQILMKFLYASPPRSNYFSCIICPETLERA